MMMQGQEPVEEFAFDRPHGFAGRQGADTSLRNRYKPADRRSPSTPCQKEPRTTSRLPGMVQARRGFANLKSERKHQDKRPQPFLAIKEQGSK
jgi:hypothetical protein